jgi:uncharacterized protein UPF0175
MSATVEISLPDSLVKALGSDPTELPRKMLEALAAQCYQLGKITHAQVGEALGLDRWQTDGFLKNAQAYRPSEASEFEADLAKLRNISK